MPQEEELNMLETIYNADLGVEVTGKTHRAVETVDLMQLVCGE